MDFFFPLYFQISPRKFSFYCGIIGNNKTHATRGLNTNFLFLYHAYCKFDETIQQSTVFFSLSKKKTQMRKFTIAVLSTCYCYFSSAFDLCMCIYVAVAGNQIQSMCGNRGHQKHKHKFILRTNTSKKLNLSKVTFSQFLESA